MVRQESVDIQHSEGCEAVSLSERKRLSDGREEETMSTKRPWNSAVPICGVALDVAPEEVQSVNPAEQSPLDARRAAVLSALAVRTAAAS
jgi:hypothetical protein